MTRTCNCGKEYLIKGTQCAACRQMLYRQRKSVIPVIPSSVIPVIPERKSVIPVIPSSVIPKPMDNFNTTDVQDRLNRLKVENDLYEQTNTLHPDDYHPITDEEELLRRIEWSEQQPKANKKHTLLYDDDYISPEEEKENLAALARLGF